MEINPIFTYNHGSLIVPEELRDSEFLHEGARLELVASNCGLLLQPVQVKHKRTPEQVMAAWDALANVLLDTKTSEQQGLAAVRKQRATETLENLHSSGRASATDLKCAEREWEFADDALDSGITDR
ncbi:hypothetical protein [Terriglobus sp.]|uniref:hypothetical protein n=1 Tax=Terriglobus sp. TaxID=1889013 RepID=UPI003AFF7570